MANLQQKFNGNWARVKRLSVLLGIILSVLIISGIIITIGNNTYAFINTVFTNAKSIVRIDSTLTDIKQDMSEMYIEKVSRDSIIINKLNQLLKGR